MDERVARIARNETLFRQVNERLNEVGESFSLVSEIATFVCECADLSCSQQIRVALREYERIRDQPHWFLVVPGHETPDVESVVERGDEYVVVEKHPGPGTDVAIDEDPRN